MTALCQQGFTNCFFNEKIDHIRKDAVMAAVKITPPIVPGPCLLSL